MGVSRLPFPVREGDVSLCFGVMASFRKGSPMFNRVVIPLDGSSLAEAAIPLAVEFARLSGATIHLVRVVDDSWLTRSSALGMPVGSDSVGDILVAEVDDATRYLSALQRQLEGTGIPITVEVRRGRAADEIRGSVAEGDLLAIASHGRSGFSRLALGSVTEDITRHMHTPVLLCHARDSETEDDGQPLAPGKIAENRR